MRRAILLVCYLGGFSVVAYCAVRFYGYYTLPLIDRPHSPFHPLAKPGGKIGHGLGVVGSSMIVLLLLYSVRKRGIIEWGSLTTWLNVHIMFGILGPLLITLHSAFKFGGIVSVSYFSMIAVMASGIFGRYLYVQIPRVIHGGELSTREIRKRKEELSAALIEEFGLTEEEIGVFETKLGLKGKESKRAISALLSMLVSDLMRPFRYLLMRRTLKRRFPNISSREKHLLVRGIKELGLLTRRAGYLDITHRIFYYWHVIHRPFAYVMILIMLIHVTVVVFFGYRWVF